MAQNTYYNPLDNDNENYYQPESNVAPRMEIGSTLKLMGTAFALNIAGSIVTRRLIGFSKSTLKSWSAGSTTGIRKNLADKTITTYRNIKAYTSPIKRTITESSVYKAGQERRKLLEGMKGESGYGIKRLQTAFKNPATFIASVAGVWKRNVLSGMAVAYGVDQMLGFTRDMGLEKKEWYDVPGKISNFGKWLGYSTIAGMTFGAAGPIVGAIGSAGFRTVQKTFQGEFGKKVLNWASRFSDNRLDNRFQGLLTKHESEFVDSSIKKGLHFGKNVSEAFRSLQDSLYTLPEAVREARKAPNISFGQRTQKVFGFLKTAVDEAKAALNKPKTSPTSTVKYAGLNTFYEFQEWTRKEAEYKGLKKIPLDGAQLKDTFYSEIHKHKDRTSILQKIFGKVLQPVLLKDVLKKDVINDVLGNLKQKYVKSDADQLMDNILNMTVGHNIYKDWKNPRIIGGRVDLNFLDPIHLVKKALSPILTYQVRAPFIKSTFSLADLTNTHRWVADSPDYFGTRNRPEFRFNDKNYSSVADVGDQDGNRLYIYTKGGKWSIFDGATVHQVDTHRSLYFSHKTGYDKSHELKSITINRLKHLKDELGTAEYNKLIEELDHGKIINNKWLHFLDRAKLGLPAAAEKLFRKIESRFSTSKDYRLEFNSIFDDPLGKHDTRMMGKALSIIDTIYGRTSQILSRVGRSRDAMSIAAKAVDIDDNPLSYIWDDQTFIDKISALHAKGEIANKDVIRSIEDIKAYPEKAKHHNVIQRLGHFSEMTSYDVARTNVIEDVFNKDFLKKSDKNKPHPLLNLAEEWYRKNLITRSEKDALLLHAKLSPIIREDKLIKGLDFSSDGTKLILDNVRDRAKQNKWDITNELINFISNNDIIKSSIELSQEKTFSRIKFATDPHPFVSLPDKGLEILGDFALKATERTTDMMAEWLPFKKYYMENHGWTGNLKYIGRVVGTTAAVFGAYRILDTITASNPLFDETSLEEGITGLAADNIAKARLFGARVADITGVTGTMKYLHGLAPFSESSIPGMMFGSVLGLMSKSPPLRVARYAIGGALVNRLASPYLPNLTKSYEELKEEYSGRKEVPIMKSPTWLLGGTPWEGSNVVGYSPNWYVRAKSRWKETDTLYGSAFRRLIHEPLPLLGFNVGDILDPYYMERCVVEDTLILKENSEVIQIKDLNVGDTILTHNGTKQKVLEKWIKHIDENIISIKTALSNIDNKTTREHRYLAIKSSICFHRKNRKTPCFNKTWIKCKRCKYKKNYIPEWVRADELEKNDFLVYPRIKIKEKSNSGYVSIHNQTKHNNKNIPKQIIRNRLLWRLFGYYLAEGYCGDRTVVFDFHSKETEYHNDVISIIKSLFKIECTTHQDGNKFRIICSNSILARFFKSSFGSSCYDKHIPDEIYYSSSILLKELIIGYFRGNGSDQSNDCSISCISVSQNLIFQIRSILFSLGFIPTYSYIKSKKENEADQHLLFVYGNNINDLRSYIGFKINKQIKSPKWYFIDDNYIYVKIKEINFTKFSGNVIDVKIEKSHSFLGILASYHNSHYFTRPYPITGGIFDEFPGVGKILSSTVGRILKPPKTMHQEFLEGGSSVRGGTPGDPYPFAIRPPTIPEGMALMNPNGGPGNTTAGMANNFGKISLMNNRNWSESAAEDFLYDIQNFAGLKGFLAGTITNRIFGENTVVPTLQTAGRIASFSRSYTDLNLGGMGILTEPLRRLIEKPNYRQYGLNPIPNRMPNWLPAHFLKGDPYEKILRGELRLPGDAYLSTHTNVKRTLPARACFTPDTLIDTSKGLVPIITAKDSLTNDGTYQKILALHEKDFDGEILDIELVGINKKYNINVTDNHDIFSIKTNKCKYYPNEPKSKRCCFECKNKNALKYCKESDYSITENKAKDLESGDYLVTPIIKITNNIKSIDLFELLKIYNKYTFKKNGVYSNGIKRYDRYLNITSELMKLIGFYLAEGSLSSSQTTFSFHSNEIEYHTFIKNITEKLFHSSTTILITNNSARVTSNSTILRDILESLCGKAKNKHLPKEIYNIGNKNINALLSGYFAGDGWYIKKSNKKSGSEIGVATCIENLSFSIFKLLCSLGFRPGLCYRKGKDVQFIKEDRIISSTQRYDIRLYDNQANVLSNIFGFDKNNEQLNVLIYKGFIPYKIKSISKKKYIGKVYDLTIENNHNYCVPFALVHNSMIGGTTQNIVQYFTGLIPPTQLESYNILEKGTAFHESVQRTLASEGMLIQAEAFVQDVKNDITGHVDAIIRDGYGGRGRRALEIKTINDEAFAVLDAPKSEHYSQLNFYLRMLNMKRGTLLYVNRENPSQVKTFDIPYSKSRWEEDVKKLYEARKIAATMMEEGVADTLGFSYSWVDRLKILADVAPNSLEYKEAKKIVDTQIKYGVLNKDDLEKYHSALKIKQARIRSYELYPNRFKGKVLHPENTANIQSINEDIKAAAEYSLPERMIGALWERFTNTNTFIVNKLFAAKDPLEHYKMTRLYGKEYKPWDEPIRGWLEPYSRGLAAKTDPFAGALSYGMGGLILGGPLGAIVGVGAGAIYGTGHGLYRFMTNSTYIPASIKEKREIMSYFDAAKFERNDMLAQLSTGLTQQEYLQQKEATLTAFNQGGKGATVANLFRATTPFEKPYIESFLNTRDPKKREEILKYIPDDLANALKHQWSKNDSKDATKNYIQRSSEEIAAGRPKYAFDRSVLDPSVPLDDIKLKTVQEQGFDQFEFGLGWNEQMLRLQESNMDIKAANIEKLNNYSPPSPNINQAGIRGAINNLFSKDGIKSSVQVYINNNSDEHNQIDILIRRDRSRTIFNALNRREKYGL
jgi:intein/homing endonuclease